MSDINTMKIDQQRLAVHIEQNWIDTQCRRCGHERLTISSELTLFPALGAQLEVRQIPVATLFCERCGLLEHVGASIAGCIVSSLPLS